MINSFATINVGVFIELERIKKPNNLAIQTSKMFCMFVNAFRDKPYEGDIIDSWPKV